MAARTVGRILENEGVVEERAGVEEDGFGFEKEFGEEGEVLGVELLLLAGKDCIVQTGISLCSLRHRFGG